jgi:hypothetical protein
MTRRSVALLAVLALGASGAWTGCATDDAVEKDAKEAAQDADRAAGKSDEKAGSAAEEAGREAKDAGSDAVDAVDDDDGR